MLSSKNVQITRLLGTIQAEATAACRHWAKSEKDLEALRDLVFLLRLLTASINSCADAVELQLLKRLPDDSSAMAE